MRNFLNEYITSLTKKRQERIYDVLAAVQVGKEDVERIAAELVDLRISSPITIGLESVNGIIESGKFDATYNDALNRIQELYTASNLVSLLVDSHTAMLTSEVKAIEDEITAIEKAIDNYAFGLDDNGAFDYVFFESFSDQTMDETLSSVRTDRDDSNFTDDQIAYTNTKSGILTLDPDLTTTYPITGNIIENNCLSYIVTSSDISEAFNANSGTGWKANIESPSPISTSLYESYYKGAQVVIRGTLPAPSLCDTLVITPLADAPVYVMNVILKNVDESQANDPDQSSHYDTNVILDEPVLIDQPYVLSFPSQSVIEFEFTLSQPVYYRDKMPANSNEELHRKIYLDAKQLRQSKDKFNSYNYSINKKAIQHLFIKTMEDAGYKKNLYVYKAQLPVANFMFSAGELSFKSRSAKKRNDRSRFKNHTNSFVRRMIHEKLFAGNPEVLNDKQLIGVSSALALDASKLNATYKSGVSQEYPRVNVENPLDANFFAKGYMDAANFLSYKYSLGIRNVEIGRSLANFKGVYISKQLPSFSSATEVKLRADDKNYQLINSPRANTFVTSVEYSVTNKAIPRLESDWIPILPTGESDVVSERVFFDDAGVFKPRFPILTVENFSLYRNGELVSNSKLVFNKTSDGLAIKTVRMDLGEIFFNDIYTISYTPYGNPTSINFKNEGQDQNLLSSASDENGGGETFSSTGDNNIVRLSYIPYIDYVQTKSNGTYSTSTGFTGTYQPITIELNDGTIATNFTNYNGITQTDLSSVAATTVGYIHSGDKIIFNQALADPFTIYYQFLPSNVRYRVVLRANTIDYVSPIVNSVQVKAKTLKADIRRAY